MGSLSSTILQDNLRSSCQAALRSVSKENLEDLGQQTIDGIGAQGLREWPTESELWCSDELNTVVLIKFKVKPEHYGVSRIAMTNIQLIEPNPELFAIPADYKFVKNFLDYLIPLPPPLG